MVENFEKIIIIQLPNKMEIRFYVRDRTRMVLRMSGASV